HGASRSASARAPRSCPRSPRTCSRSRAWRHGGSRRGRGRWTCASSRARRSRPRRPWPGRAACGSSCALRNRRRSAAIRCGCGGRWRPYSAMPCSTLPGAAGSSSRWPPGKAAGRRRSRTRDRASIRPSARSCWSDSPPPGTARAEPASASPSSAPWPSFTGAGRSCAVRARRGRRSRSPCRHASVRPHQAGGALWRKQSVRSRHGERQPAAFHTSGGHTLAEDSYGIGLQEPLLLACPGASPARRFGRLQRGTAGGGPRFFAPLAESFHEDASVELLSRKLVVRAAQQTTAIDVVYMRLCETVDVVELESAGLRASVAVVVDEGTPTLVAHVHLPLHRVREVVRCGRGGTRSRSSPRFPAHSETFLHQLDDQHVERHLEYGREIAV